ncbi:signal peptidase I [Streptomyces sp. NPDC020917]|uniref:signal peptidase I n=1 Tax=Streptomyces sp. NPDC020917 TaxID=3365102 RepID=UPI0037910C2B
MSGWGSGTNGRPYGPPAGGQAAQKWDQGGQGRPQWQQPWQPPTPPRQHSSGIALRVALGVVAAGVVVAIAGILVPTAGGTGYRTMREVSQSMEPTYRPGDKVTIKETDGSTLRDGDIALFDGHDWGVQGALLQRVVARGGEHIVVTATGTVTVDGKVRKEPYLYPSSYGGFSPPVDLVVPQGRLFMMGDHRVDSLDSRYHHDVASGTIAESAVAGKAVNSASAPSTDFRWAGLGAGVAVAGLVAAIVVAVRSKRRAVPLPPPPPSY